MDARRAGPGVGEMVPRRWVAGGPLAYEEDEPDVAGAPELPEPEELPADDPADEPPEVEPDDDELPDVEPDVDEPDVDPPDDPLDPLSGLVDDDASDEPDLDELSPEPDVRFVALLSVR